MGFLVLVWMSCSPPAEKKGLFEEGRVLGVNKNPQLEETSGLVASSRHPGLFWAHNDSGHKPELFLLDSSGKTVRTFQLIDARNIDWEDIAIAPASDGTPTLFIGDIGDNRQHKLFKYIYCVREPALDDPEKIPVDKTLVIRMADRPRDSEALLADPQTGNLYFVTKMEKEVRVYEIPYPSPTDTVELHPAAKLSSVRFITAGDISSTGEEILLKSYSSVYYWKRVPGKAVVETLEQDPVELSYEREPQGESIAWARDGSGFYTLSENGKGERGKMIFYARVVRDSLISGDRPIPVSIHE